MVENKIYKAIIKDCEAMENVTFNGHHLAQKLTKLVAIALLSDKERTIYNTLSVTPITTSDIAIKLGIPNKIISAQLIQIERKVSFVHSKLVNNNRQWRIS